jgi:hypothetical protein
MRDRALHRSLNSDATIKAGIDRLYALAAADSVAVGQCADPVAVAPVTFLVGRAAVLDNALAAAVAATAGCPFAYGFRSW